VIKRVLSLLLAFLTVGSLICGTVSAAIFRSANVTPMFKQGGYRITLNLNTVKDTGNDAYLAIYNSKGRMIDLMFADAQPRIIYDISPEEYPVTIKVLAWKDGSLIPLGEYQTLALESASQIIINHLSDFVTTLKQKFNMPDGSFMYELTQILDSIDEEIVEDAKDDSLIIDREFFSAKYPEAYARTREIAHELKQTEGGIDNLLTQFSSIIDNNDDYEQLAITLFTLLGVYDYI